MSYETTTKVDGKNSDEHCCAEENWARYKYGKDRGHLAYMAQAQKCEGMYLGAGEQWNDDDKAVLEAQKRPFYEFNEVMPSVNSALGYQIANRMDIAFKPRGENGDLVTATILSKVVMQVCDMTAQRWHETQIYGDGLIEQRGYYDLRMNFDDNIKGDIVLDTLDPRDVIPDPDSKSYDPDRWADVIVSRWMTLDEIEQMYGQKSRDKAEESGDVGTDNGDLEAGTPRNKFGNNSGGSQGLYDAYGKDTGLARYRIIDRQKWEFENTECLVYPETGDVKSLKKMTEQQIGEAIAKGAVKSKRMRRCIKWSVSTYSTTLFSKDSPYEHFTVVPYFAYFRRGKTRGMVDNAIGPQEALNKAVSQFVHIINTSANSGWVVEEGSLTNMETEELKATGAMTGLVIEHKKGTTPPKKIEANSVPTGVDRLIDRATQALKDVTVPDSMRGLQGSAVSGVAKQADQFASQQMLAVPMDNLSYTRQLFAKRVTKLVQRYYDSYRIFRITETDPMTGKPKETILEINKFDPMTGSYINDVTVGQYDVVITEQPMQVTFENSQFNQSMEMRKNGVAIPDATVIRYSSLSDKQDILANMQSTQPPADPLLEAKSALLAAQTRKADGDTTARGVEAQYSAIQTAQVIAATPQTSALADILLKSAGFVDRDAGPIVPQAAPVNTDNELMEPANNTDNESLEPPTNTSPMTPANPAVGMMSGIETPAADGVLPT